jgi:RNA recognition motif-containing protein
MKKLYVGNLDYRMSDQDEVRAMFEAYGVVVRFAWPLDREAERALSALNGCLYQGRPMRVAEATPLSSARPR